MNFDIQPDLDRRRILLSFAVPKATNVASLGDDVRRACNTLLRDLGFVGDVRIEGSTPATKEIGELPEFRDSAPADATEMPDLGLADELVDAVPEIKPPEQKEKHLAAERLTVRQIMEETGTRDVVAARFLNVLTSLRVETVADLAKLTIKKVRKTRGFGESFEAKARLLMRRAGLGVLFKNEKPRAGSKLAQEHDELQKREDTGIAFREG